MQQLYFSAALIAATEALSSGITSEPHMTTPAETRPIKPFVILSAGDKPYLAGMVCKTCGETLLGGVPRLACPKCASRAGFNDIKLADTGSLFVFTTVARSFPGVVTPFISAVVDLDGGGTLKGNLRHVKPEMVKFGMAVKVVFDDAGRTDKQNNSYISYFFEPVAEEARA
jgi:uncharacterized protein